MNADLYSASGEKKGTVALPAALFDAPVNAGLMHQAVVMQMSNRRGPIAHTKSRGEIRGSTRKLYAQKGTGRARRGAVRSPLLRGGNKAFGPKKNANFRKEMPRKMRHAALRSCLSVKAQGGAVIALESLRPEMKTKEAVLLLGKLPVQIGRPVLIVVPSRSDALTRSVRNIPRVKTLPAAYLNPVDVLGSRHIVFLTEALAKAEEVFGSSSSS